MTSRDRHRRGLRRRRPRRRRAVHPCHRARPSSNRSPTQRPVELALFSRAYLLSPVDVAKPTVFQAAAIDNPLQTIRQIVEEDGVHGLFKGRRSVKSVETVLRNFLYFYVYEWAKARRSYFHLAGLATGLRRGCWRVKHHRDAANRHAECANASVFWRAKRNRRGAKQLIAGGPSGMWRGFTVSPFSPIDPALCNL